MAMSASIERRPAPERVKVCGLTKKYRKVEKALDKFWPNRVD
jgi:hypothetical protein